MGVYNIWEITKILKKIVNYDEKHRGPKPTAEERKYADEFVKEFQKVTGK